MITSADIIRMAREAGLEKYHLRDLLMTYAFDFCIERFARAAYAAGAAAEREACAKVCDEVIRDLYIVDGDASEEVSRCAAAIRAKGEK